MFVGFIPSNQTITTSAQQTTHLTSGMIMVHMQTFEAVRFRWFMAEIANTTLLDKEILVILYS